MTTTYADPADVRAWATTNGFTVGSRGKFSPELTKAYNKSHSVKYVAGKHVDTVTVAGRDKNGKKTNRKVNVADARVWAAEHGFAVGARGKLSDSILAAAAGLTPLPKAETGATVEFEGKAQPVKAVRAMLAARGVEVGSRGRLPQKVLS